METAERGVPVTRRIVRDLEAKIESGELPPGARLPSVRSLASEYEISTAVTLAAYRTLEKKGLVERRAGSGTFVSGRPESGYNTFFNWNCVLPAVETEAMLAKALPTLHYEAFPASSYDYNPQFLEWIRDKEKNPGLAGINEGQLPVLASRGDLLALDEFLKGAPRLRFPGELLRALSWNGKCYALPVVYSPAMLFFNRRIFREAGIACPDAGWNWQDLYNHTRQLTRESNGRVTRYGLAILFTINSYAPFVFQNGGELFDRSGNCVLDSDEAFEGLSFFSDLFLLPGCCSHHRFGESRAAMAELMNNDLAAMMIGDAVDYSLLCERMPREDWGMVHLPGKKNHRTSLSVWAIGLTRGSRARERFQALEQFFTSDDYPEYCRQIHGFPANADPLIPELAGILRESSPSLQVTSPNAVNCFRETLDVVFSHKLPLTREQCADFRQKINARL